MLLHLTKFRKIRFQAVHILPSSVQKLIESQLSVKVRGFSAASGGCINNGGEVHTNKETYFVKWNDADRYPAMFLREAEGLKLLFAANAICVPEVICTGMTGDGLQLIVMQFIRSSARCNKFWELLGQRLASLHRNTQPHFGLNQNNYIGSLRQYNEYRSTWSSFFIEQRLEKQVELAVQEGRLIRTDQKHFDVLYKIIPELMPEEPPALLHGDLWGGNLLVNETGEPCLIDPAVYYGHREAEIAYTQLFGGFNHEFYTAYEEVFPLLKGFDKRADVYNLYPLLVHVNLFGGGYANQVRSILQKVLNK